MIKTGSLVRIKKSYYMDRSFSLISLKKAHHADDLLLVVKLNEPSPNYGRCFYLLFPNLKIYTWPEISLEEVQ